MCISSDTDIHNVISSVSCSVVSNSLRLHDWRPPGSSVHGILQARILEWVAIPFSRISSWSRDQTQISCVAGRFFSCLSYRKTMCWIVKEKLFVLRSTFLLETGGLSHSAHSLWILVWTEKWEGVCVCILYVFLLKGQPQPMYSWWQGSPLRRARARAKGHW